MDAMDGRDGMAWIMNTWCGTEIAGRQALKMYVSILIYIHVCIYICVHVCVYIYIYACILTVRLKIHRLLNHTKLGERV